MSIFRTFASISLLIATAIGASAEDLIDQQTRAAIESHKLVYLDGKGDSLEQRHDIDSMRRVVSKFFYDQFQHFLDPAAPYFMLMSKDAGLSLGIGGAVRMRAYYDWGGSPNNAGFSPMLLPMAADPTSRRSFSATPSGTCFFVRLIGQNDVIGEYQLYVETDFTGYNGRDLKLKKAYAMVRDFTVGYASSTFADPAAEPAMVDAAGPNNKVGPTSVLVRYMPTIKDRWVVAVSAELPSTAADVDNVNNAKVRDYLPDFAAFAQYQWSESQHVRLSGMVRTLPYRNLLTKTNHNVVGWGLQLSAVCHPTSHLTTYLTANYGHGYGSMGGDLQLGNYDLISVSPDAGQMYAPASWGWCAGLQYNFKPNLFMTLIGSQTRFSPSHTVSPDTYKTGLLGAANLFWLITPRLTTGLEFCLGHRLDFSGDKHTSYRMGAMCMFSF